MYAFKLFVKKNTVLCTAAILALISMLFVRPDAEYLSYINFSVLTILAVLMAAVAGLSSAGVFVSLSSALTRRTTSVRKLALLLILVCFFSSALITNDVALITFVPFTIALFRKEKSLGRIVIMETVAANLGSLITPIGNPQNIFIFTNYGLSLGEFFRAILPLGSLSLVLTIGVSLFAIRDCGNVEAHNESEVHMRNIPVYALLFLLGILTVLKVIEWKACLVAALILILLADRGLLRCIDYSLLASFVCFFVLVGNLSRIEPVKIFMSSVVTGNELIVGALASQVISNVPAATMLSGFTFGWKELLLGVNIGGLGTPIASMASLISLKLYNNTITEKNSYMREFLIINFSLLLVLLIVFSLI